MFGKVARISSLKWAGDPHIIIVVSTHILWCLCLSRSVNWYRRVVQTSKIARTFIHCVSQSVTSVCVWATPQDLTLHLKRGSIGRSSNEPHNFNTDSGWPLLHLHPYTMSLRLSCERSRHVVAITHAWMWTSRPVTELRNESIVIRKFYGMKMTYILVYFGVYKHLRQSLNFECHVYILIYICVWRK